VREIARSNLTPEEARPMRSRYKSLIEKVQESADWRQHLSVPYLGIALERIGEFVPTLEFYEQFFPSRNPKLRQFARERWIATKKKQLAYEQSTANTDRVAEIHQEIAAVASDSGIIDIASIISEPPSPDLIITASKASKPSSTKHHNLEPTAKPVQAKSWIEGLPPGVELQRLGVGTVSFQVGNIEVKVAKSQKVMRVLIADIFTSKEFRVDLDEIRGKITLQDVVVEASDGNQLCFKVPAQEYGGVVFYGSENPRIELNLPGCSEKICLQLY
jgi:hypothetical protein